MKLYLYIAVMLFSMIIHLLQHCHLSTQYSTHHSQLFLTVFVQHHQNLLKLKKQYLPSSETSTTVRSSWCGFKIIGDNIDKNVKPRYYRNDKQVYSLHYYHSYAVKDRIDFSSSPDKSAKPVSSLYTHKSVQHKFIVYVSIVFQIPNVTALPYNQLPPSTSDNQTLMYHLSIPVSRVLTTYIPYFKTSFGDIVTQPTHSPFVSKRDVTKV